MKLASLRGHHAYARHFVKPIVESLGLLALGLATLGATAAQALPVIPGAAGFGMDTPAGRGGAVYRVTNLNASGAGSLKACIDGTGPRTCVFEVSGAIRLTSDLIIRNGKLTIAGQTAPSPGIMIRGAAIEIHASDVLIQHIRVRTGDDTNGPDPDNRDSLKIEGTDAKPVKTWSSITARSAGPSTKSPAPGVRTTTSLSPTTSSPSRSTSRCIQRTTARRARRTATACCSAPRHRQQRHHGRQPVRAHRGAQSAVARRANSCSSTTWSMTAATMDLDLQSEDGRVTKSSVVGNVFLRGPSFAATRGRSRAHQRQPTLVPGSKVYVNDNCAPDSRRTDAGRRSPAAT